MLKRERIIKALSSGAVEGLTLGTYFGVRNGRVRDGVIAGVAGFVGGSLTNYALRPFFERRALLRASRGRTDRGTSVD